MSEHKEQLTSTTKDSGESSPSRKRRVEHNETKKDGQVVFPPIVFGNGYLKRRKSMDISATTLHPPPMPTHTQTNDKVDPAGTIIPSTPTEAPNPPTRSDPEKK